MLEHLRPLLFSTELLTVRQERQRFERQAKQLSSTLEEREREHKEAMREMKVGLEAEIESLVLEREEEEDVARLREEAEGWKRKAKLYRQQRNEERARREAAEAVGELVDDHSNKPSHEGSYVDQEAYEVLRRRVQEQEAEVQMGRWRLEELEGRLEEQEDLIQSFDSFAQELVARVYGVEEEEEEEEEG